MTLVSLGRFDNNVLAVADSAMTLWNYNPDRISYDKAIEYDANKILQIKNIPIALVILGRIFDDTVDLRKIINQFNDSKEYNWKSYGVKSVAEAIVDIIRRKYKKSSTMLDTLVKIIGFNHIGDTPLMFEIGISENGITINQQNDFENNGLIFYGSGSELAYKFLYCSKLDKLEFLMNELELSENIKNKVREAYPKFSIDMATNIDELLIVIKYCLNSAIWYCDEKGYEPDGKAIGFPLDIALINGNKQFIWLNKKF